MTGFSVVFQRIKKEFYVNISQVVPASNSAGNEEDSTSSLPQEAV
jgi:hypothetical protein